jgi:hypothetical protein
MRTSTSNLRQSLWLSQQSSRPEAKRHLLVSMLAEQAHAWMISHAVNGTVECSAPSLVVALDAPCGRVTMWRALSKLEAEGRIRLITKGNGSLTTCVWEVS